MVSQAVTTPTATPTSPPTVTLDPDQPTTNVQIRLADGSRLLAKFNPTHTVNDIRQYINVYPNENNMITSLFINSYSMYCMVIIGFPLSISSNDSQKLHSDQCFMYINVLSCTIHTSLVMYY